MIVERKNKNPFFFFRKNLVKIGSRVRKLTVMSLKQLLTVLKKVLNTNSALEPSTKPGLENPVMLQSQLLLNADLVSQFLINSVSA